MELSSTMSLFPHVSRFIMLTVAATVALPPSLPSQTPKELIGEACYNELQHRERKTLWSYTAERHNHELLVLILLVFNLPPETTGRRRKNNRRTFAHCS